MTRNDILAVVRTAISEETKIPIGEIGEGNTFFELGLDSVTSIFVMERIENQLHIALNPIDFWDYPTVGQYAGRVQDICTNGSHR